MTKELPEVGVIGCLWSDEKSTTLGRTPKYFKWVYGLIREVTVYVDGAIMYGTDAEVFPGYKVYAWLVESRAASESRSVSERIESVKFVMNNAERVSKRFTKLFTHNKEIAALADNFYYIPSHGHFIHDTGIHDKTKLVSMTSSNVRFCYGHDFRLDWVYRLRGKVDVYGRGINPMDRKEEALNDYMFSVTIENDQYESYWTEKILDCFVTGTIPVYHGAPDIGDFFNMDGIIILTDEFDISMLTPELYYSKMDAIKDNFNRALKFGVIEDLLIEQGHIDLCEE